MQNATRYRIASDDDDDTAAAAPPAPASGLSFPASPAISVGMSDIAAAAAADGGGGGERREQKYEWNTIESLMQQGREFAKDRKPFIYILTPCYGSMCTCDYVNCLMETCTFFRDLQIPVKVEFCRNDSLVSRARNNLVAHALSDPGCTHIFFIDSDIIWSAIDVLKLLLHDKPVIGGVYPLKRYNWDWIINSKKHVAAGATPESESRAPPLPQQWLEKKRNIPQLANAISDVNMVRYNLLSYNVNYISEYMQVENNIAEVRLLANGFLMIQRPVLEQMMQAYPATKYTDDTGFATNEEEIKYSYALFDTAIEEGHYYSEDWTFCSRWRKLGGRIFADVTINLGHVGSETYMGSYLSTIV